MINLLMSEMRRALHRRVVWVLIALALLGTGILGLVAFFDSAGRSVADLGKEGTHPALMVDWWVSGGGDGILMIAGLPLLLGGVFGGASVVGAEWRAGTVTTALTWEPRRLRLHVARMTSAFLLAAVIAFALEGLFLVATLPAVLTHGSTAGTDSGWWIGLLGAMARIAVTTGVAAVLAASLATLGRGTTFALGATFAWLAVIENLVRGWKPGLQTHLIGDNLAIVITWAQLDGAAFTRDAPVAAVAIVAYCGSIAVAAAASFVRRDVVGAG
ncbi:MAG: hypothetical protein M3Q20_04970 [Actinomycetota bacterium]|nr:hypothetical protein [Actinomycetota bacterium]